MSEQIHDQIRAVRPTPAGPVPESLKRSILAAVRADPQPSAGLPSQRRRRGWTPTVPIVVAAVLATAGVGAAAGLVVSAATKRRAHDLRVAAPGDMGGPGVRGPALVRELERLRAETPYPPGIRDAFPTSRLEGAAIGSVQAVVEERASCYWQRYWVQATESHDPRGQADALKVLYQTAYWPAYTAPNQGNRRVSALRVAHQAKVGDLAAFKTRMACDCRAVFTTTSSR